MFTQEKPGFAEARWFEAGTQVATLALSDAANDAPVKSKFDTATEKLGEFPVVTVGKNQSAVLVAGKYQVKVSSPTLDHAARRALLEKFDLAGLAKL